MFELCSTQIIIIQYRNNYSQIAPVTCDADTQESIKTGFLINQTFV